MKSYLYVRAGDSISCPQKKVAKGWVFVDILRIMVPWYGGIKVFKEVVYLTKVKKLSHVIIDGNIIVYRNAINPILLVDMFSSLCRKIGIMSFPNYETDKRRHLMQQNNYEAFINTMAEIIQKYRDI